LEGPIVYTHIHYLENVKANAELEYCLKLFERFNHQEGKGQWVCVHTYVYSLLKGLEVRERDEKEEDPRRHDDMTIHLDMTYTYIHKSGLAICKVLTTHTHIQSRTYRSLPFPSLFSPLHMNCETCSQSRAE